MSELIERFCAFHHTYNGISEHRRVAQRKVLRKFVASAGGDAAALEPSHLRDYLAAEIEHGLKPSTVGFHLNLIRPFVGWLWDERVIDAERLMGFQRVKPPRGASCGRPRPYTRKQIAKLREQIAESYPWARDGDEERGAHFFDRYLAGRSPWARGGPYARRAQLEAIVAIALYGGPRREEIFRLELRDMHYDNAYVVVRGARKNHNAEERARAVPMLRPMQRAIQRWLDARERLAPTHDRPWLSLWSPHVRDAMPYGTFTHLLGKVGGGWEFHRLRHTFATEALRAGMRESELMEILGHSNITQTMRYAQIATVDVLKGGSRVEAALERTFG